jgi:hypothetical protein
MADAPKVKYGEDDLTFSLNKKDAEKKTEDWHSDYDGKVMIGGQQYYLNGYQKNDTWVAGKLKVVPADKAPQKTTPAAAPTTDMMDDEIPF